MKKRINNTILYAVNNFGAAFGSIITGFFLIKTFGITESLFIIFVLSLIVLAGSIILQHFQIKIDIKEDTSCLINKETLPVNKLYLLAFFSGFIFLQYEMLMQRIVSLIFGNRIYVSSIILFFIFTGMTYGSFLNKKWLQKYTPGKIITFCYSISVILISCLLLCFPVLFENDYSQNSIFVTVIFCLFLCMIPASLLGMIFPLTLSIEPDEQNSNKINGKYIGYLYAVNTLACLLGALITTYCIIKNFGTFNSFVLTGFIAFVPVFLFNKKKNFIIFFALLINLSVLLIPFIYKNSHNTIIKDEDEYGQFKIIEIKKELYKVFNNCTELVFTYGAERTQYVQEMHAHFPMLYSKKPEKILNIGTGYGITTGAFSLYDDVKEIDTIEIIPMMIKHASFFKKQNYSYFDNPKVNIYIADGRQYLAKTKKKYDVISINVSDPYLPGSSSLFSREFYIKVKSRLTEKGIVCQHIFGFDNHSLIHQFKEYFSYIKAIPAYENGITIIGSSTPFIEKPFFRNINLKHIKMTNERFSDLIRKGDMILVKHLTLKSEFTQEDDKPVLEYRTIPGKLGKLFSNM
ncbi:hypothetical protein BVX93_01890 [bacterium B13(2017)]|nr:hypothetical protein BVX93_01890 [bacterium B13(2017)]